MKRLWIACAVLFLLPCLAVATPLPDTGQTKCYDYAGEMPCPNQGEPFYGQDAQYVYHPPSYTKLDQNGNDLPDEATEWAMVRDNVTELIWENKTDDGSIHDKDSTYNWYNAQDVFIAALNAGQFGGYNDWRLPTIKELIFIVSRDRINPSISAAYFPNTVISNYYWTSTSYADPSFPNLAWVVHFSTGYTNNSGNKTSGYFHVRAVRGVQTSNSFVDNLDGTVTDTDTSLMWQKDTALGTYTWEQALYYCENLTLADYEDWRLPNINELHSLVDYTHYNPSIDTAFFPNTIAENYFSSTSPPGDPASIWNMVFYDGMIGGGKGGESYVRAVRGCGETIYDYDCDSILNEEDNCLDDYNPGQVDTDADGIGDVCDQCINDPDNDADSDNLCGDIDNCPSTPNSSLLGTCIIGNIGLTCTDNEDCGEVIGYCSQNQEDDYPPQGNGIGDACDCEGNFNCDIDNDVDGSDAFTFKASFGRSPVLNPCTNESPCHGDFNCDHDCDGTDAARFKQDFGRSAFSYPCPACTMGAWCAYE